MRAAVGLAIVLTAALAGCTAAGSEPTPAASIEPSPTASAPTGFPEGVLGTTTLADRVITLSYEDDAYFLSGLGEQVGTFLVTPVEVAAGGCLDGEFTALPIAAPAPEGIPIPFESTYGGDLTFLRTAALVDTSGFEDGCLYDVLAAAPMQWTSGPRYESLAASDSGASGGALGDTVVESGVPVSYTVRQGDVFDEIAARFGLTVDQLDWLNPRRAHDDLVAYTGDVLNLRVDRR